MTSFIYLPLKRFLKRYLSSVIAVTLLMLVLPIMSQKVSADALGVTDSVEIVKLTEVVNRMTQLLELTEYLIDVQEDMEELQERSLRSKSASYAGYLQLLGALFGGEVAVFSQNINVLVSMDVAMRELAARTSNTQRQEGLYLVADSLRLLIDASVILETSSQALKEASSGEDFNSQDQTLSSIHRTLALINSENTQVRHNRNIRSVANQNMLFGSFNVFSGR